MLISVLNKVHSGTDQIKPLQHPAYKEGKGRHYEGAEDGEEFSSVSDPTAGEHLMPVLLMPLSPS